MEVIKNEKLFRLERLVAEAIGEVLRPSSSSGIASSLAVLRPLSFFVAWNGVLCLVFDGFPPLLAALKDRLNSFVAADGSSDGGGAETSGGAGPESSPQLPRENFGSKWPKVTLGAMSDGASALSLEELSDLRKLCRLHGERLAAAADIKANAAAAEENEDEGRYDEEERTSAAPTTVVPVRVGVESLTVVAYAARGLEDDSHDHNNRDGKGRLSLTHLPLLPPVSGSTRSGATGSAALPPSPEETARARGVVSEWDNLEEYMPRVAAAGNRISSYREQSPSGSTLVTFLFRGRDDEAAEAEAETETVDSSSSGGSSSSSSSTTSIPPPPPPPQVRLKVAIAEFRAAVDARFPGRWEWLADGSLHCTIRALGSEALTA
jgi:hypothetical protein